MKEGGPFILTPQKAGAALLGAGVEHVHVDAERCILELWEDGALLEIARSVTSGELTYLWHVERPTYFDQLGP